VSRVVVVVVVVVVVDIDAQAARSGEWAQHFSNASCYLMLGINQAVSNVSSSVLTKYPFSVI